MFSFGSEGRFARYLMGFCVITTFLCIAEGVLGSLLLPDSRLPFGAYLVPPAFGLITVLTGVVTESRKALSGRQMLFRLFLQWLLIEGIVFGANLLLGIRFSFWQAVIVAAEITVIFVTVYFVLWLNERRISQAFNLRLAELQARDNAEGKAPDRASDDL